MSVVHLYAVVLVSAMAAAIAADAPQITDFAWRGTLALPVGASLARVELPLQAMLHMQSSEAHDLRVFNAPGAVVPFAVLGGADLSRPAPAAVTAVYKAYPLFAANTAGQASRGAVSVQVNTAGAHGSARVRWSDAASPSDMPDSSAQPLQAALFDMRAEKQTVDALMLAVELPHNTLVPVTVATSTDLKDWTVVATKGPLFQFDGADGADAPLNTTVELRQALQLQGRYLRLAWTGQAGVKVQTLTARVVGTQTVPTPLRAALPPGRPDGTSSLSWSLPFAAPVSALHLQAVQDNTFVPVRIQGRSDAAQPWRTLASSVVYRLDGTGSSNPPTPLHGASVRALRVQASQGVALPVGGLQATVEFVPLQVAFLAFGAGPFTLAIGRSQTPAAAVEPSLLGSVAPTGLGALPLATVVSVQIRPATALAGPAPGWLPEGTSLRSVLLWAVLGVGVLVLGGVAYALLRQLGARR
jgi:hypothetical protein